MAFNPLSNFHKYRQFWMASVLLLTMITFVLCSGTKGDLGDWIGRWFNKSSSNLLAIDGSNYNDRELTEIRDRRKLASIYMLRASDVCRNNLLGRADNEEAQFKANASQLNPQEKVDAEGKIILLRDKAYLLYKNSKKVNYFDGGANLDDLVDFLLLLKQADRLGIDLTDKHVTDLVHIELNAGEAQFTDRESAYVLQEARSRAGMDRASESLLAQALRDEYRVKIAQLVLWKAPNIFSHNLKDPADLPPERRVPLPPSLLYDYFKQNRAMVDIALVPIEVRDFVKMLSDEEFQKHHDELTKFFETYKRMTHDPALETPGFELQRRVKIEYLTADAKSKHYQRVSQAALLLQTSNALSFAPAQGTAAWIPLTVGEPLRDEIADIIFKNTTRRFREDSYLGAAWKEADVLTAMTFYRGLRDPRTVTAIFAQTSLPGFMGASAVVGTAHVWHDVRRDAQLQQAVREEARRRAPVFATLIALGATGSPYPSLEALRRMEISEGIFEPPYLPLSVYRDDMLKRLQEEMAQGWAIDNMIALRDALAASKAKGKLAVERVLDENVEKFGLARVKSKEFYNRYSIAQAPELAPFVESYKKNFSFVNLIEGRTGPKVLKEEDFYKLFESGEPFAPVEKYEAKAWPPDLKIKANVLQRNDLERELRRVAPLEGKANRLFQKKLEEIQANNPAHIQRESTFPLFRLGQGKPVVYWKVEEEGAKVPASLDVVKERVVEAWLTQQAREAKAWPKATEVALALQKTLGSFSPELLKLSKDLGREPVRLYKVAPLVPEQMLIADGFVQTTYQPYKLPADAIPYPRDDTVANLLQLYQLKKPFEAKIEGFKELDDFNKKLFEEMARAPKDEAGNRYVQIITNKPRTAFYVAVVTTPVPLVERPEFLDAWSKAKQYQMRATGTQFDREGPVGPRDTLVDRAQDQAANEYRQQLMRQLRKSLEWANEKEARKLFDHGDGG